MKRFVTIFIFDLCLLLCPFRLFSADRPVDFADPFIFYENGTYYLYGTRYDDGIGVLVSRDLRHWSVPEGKERWMALYKDDSYGERNFWAPEVYHVGGRYIMYYSAEEHICAAESDSPLGPFRQKVQRPMLEEKGIDCSLFIDEDGKPYLFWVRFQHGNVIWSAELEPDCMTVKESTMRFCLRAEEPWETVKGSVTEGPFVIRHGGLCYLTYSANDFRSKDYGLGLAVSDSPEGPWKKSVSNPFLCRPRGLVGTGHHALFIDGKGKCRIVFHAHFSDSDVQPRLTYVGRYRFKRDGRIVISSIEPLYCQ